MLFFKECRKVICSLTFVLYVVVVIAMYVTQFCVELEQPLTQPVPGADGYGVTLREDPQIIMPAAVDELLGDYLSGSYTAYPFMFYKEVKLKEEKRLEMRGILEELTGLSEAQLDGFTGYQESGYFYHGTDEEGNPVMLYQEAVMPEYTLPESLTYERFCELMQRADELIGGGSSYSEKNLAASFGKVPMSYEDAAAEYEALMQSEELGKAYLRLCCDYMGIDLAVMPVFVAVGLWQLDRKARMQALVYTRKSSAVRIVGIRYLALISCMILPLVLSFAHVITGVSLLYPQIHIAWGKALGTAFLWLLPNILAATAVGALLTELLSPLLAIFLQCVWWFLALDKTELSGGISRFGLLVRHNSLEGAAIWRSQWDIFVCNRLLLTAVALGCLVITIWVYERKRRGGLTWQGKLFAGRREAAAASGKRKRSRREEEKNGDSCKEI